VDNPGWLASRLAAAAEVNGVWPAVCMCDDCP